jgi:hypothetical protein
MDGYLRGRRCVAAWRSYSKSRRGGRGFVILILICRGSELEDLATGPLPQQLRELAWILVEVVSDGRVRVSRDHGGLANKTRVYGCGQLRGKMGTHVVKVVAQHGTLWRLGGRHNRSSASGCSPRGEVGDAVGQ